MAYFMEDLALKVKITKVKPLDSIVGIKKRSVMLFSTLRLFDLTPLVYKNNPQSVAKPKDRRKII